LVGFGGFGINFRGLGRFLGVIKGLDGMIRVFGGFYGIRGV